MVFLHLPGSGCGEDVECFELPQGLQHYRSADPEMILHHETVNPSDLDSQAVEAIESIRVGLRRGRVVGVLVLAIGVMCSGLPGPPPGIS